MKDDRVYLKHILRCIARIEEYTAGGRESFFASPLIQDGVIRNLQTLAESSQQPLPNDEEFNEAVQLLTKDAGSGPLQRDKSVQPYLPMPPLLGVILDGTSSWSVTWLVAAALGVAALAVCRSRASTAHR